jgi:hypothetical protein
MVAMFISTVEEANENWDHGYIRCVLVQAFRYGQIKKVTN